MSSSAPSPVDPTVNADINAGWTLTTGYLVFFMQCGFMMLSVGAVRQKNAKNIIFLIIMDATVGLLGWYATGFAFAFGRDPGYMSGSPQKTYTMFIGARNFFLTSYNNENYYIFFFQYAFAATSSTIVSGAIAERTRFEAYFCYSLILCMWIYPVVAHWQWSPEGWASRLNYVNPFLGFGAFDFAGDAAVHMVGGLAGLSGTLVMGPRIGRFGKNGEIYNMTGHNTAFYLLGVFILWFGWYGFNPGSTNILASTSGFPYASQFSQQATVTTTVCPATAVVTVLFTQMGKTLYLERRVEWDLVTTSNGALAGLVGITGSAAIVEPWAALIIGITSGWIYLAATNFFTKVVRIDDPLEAVAVHFACGWWGLMCVTAFAQPDFFFSFINNIDGTTVYSKPPWNYYGWVYPKANGRFFAANLIYSFVVIGWVMGQMVPFFLILKVCGILRVKPEHEEAGLDKSFHLGSAYPEADETEQKYNESVKGGNTSEMANMKMRIANLESKLGGNGHTHGHENDEMNSQEVSHTYMTGPPQQPGSENSKDKN